MIALNPVYKYLKQKQLYACGLFVFIISILCKIYYWLTFGKSYINQGFFKNTYENTYYLDALNNHFFEFMYFFHTKPLGILIYHKLSLLMFGNLYTGAFILTSFLDCLTALLVFLSLQSLNVNKYVSIIASINIAIVTLAWEYWRQSLHFDHPNIFMFTFFSWCLINFYNDHNKNNLLILIISCCLLGLFNSMGFIIIPFVLVLLLFLIKKTYKINFKIISLLFSPILLILILCFKNYFNVGVFAPSSVGGQNAMQFSSMWEKPLLDKLVKKSNLPKWWHLCYEQGSKVYPEIKILGSLYGTCYKKEEDKSLLKDFLRNNNNQTILDKIKKDELDLLKKPWLFHGGIPESSSRLSAEYGKLSLKVWPIFLSTEPILFITQFRTSLKIFLSGMSFFYSNDYEPQHIPRNDYVRFAGKVSYIIAFFGIFILFISPISIVYSLIKKDKLNINTLVPIYLLSVVFWSFAILTIALTCCENSRMYVSIFSLPYILGVFSINHILSIFNIKSQNMKLK